MRFPLKSRNDGRHRDTHDPQAVDVLDDPAADVASAIGPCGRSAGARAEGPTLRPGPGPARATWVRIQTA